MDLSDLKSQRMTTSYVIRVAVTTVVALAMCVVMYEEVAGGLRDFLKVRPGLADRLRRRRQLTYRERQPGCNAWH